MSKKGIVVQARLGATRLPSKIGLKLTDEYNLIEYQLRNVVDIDLPIVIAMPATSDNRTFAKSLKTRRPLQFFFGDENDVLKRFIDCADENSFETVVRVCADNPFLNVSYLANLIENWSEEFDYSSYFNAAGMPAMRTHYGLFAEVVKVQALRKSQSMTDEKVYHEHVTPFIYERPELFRLKKINMPEPFFSGIDLRLTLDTQSDLENARAIAKNVTNIQDVESIIEYCRQTGLLNSMSKEILQNQK